jgi:hypothetical protein
MPNIPFNFDLKSLDLSKKYPVTEDENISRSPSFSAESFLSPEGKEFLEKMVSQMNSDLPQISNLMSEAITKEWITDRERGGN